MTPKLHNIFPESCLLIVVGIIIGNIAVIFCKTFYDVIFLIKRRHLYEGDRPEIDFYFEIFLFHTASQLSGDRVDYLLFIVRDN
jgi:hypothetical protein